jgi:hypothetical protein
MNTIQRGNAAEAAVLHRLICADIGVLVPFGGGFPFDLGAVAPPDGRVVRIQVKSGRVRNGCIRFNAYSTDHGAGQRSYKGRADVIAVHVRQPDRVFMVPVDDCPASEGSLRLDSPRNNQRRGVRLASDYVFEAWIRSLRGQLSLEGVAHG